MRIDVKITYWYFLTVADLFVFIQSSPICIVLVSIKTPTGRGSILAKKSCWYSATTTDAFFFFFFFFWVSHSC